MSRRLADAVRAAATALRVTIAEAEAAGLRVTLPRRAVDLDAIAISATGRVTETWPAELMQSPPPLVLPPATKTRRRNR